MAAWPASLRQPTVVGELAAGLLLGPSVVGHFWPGAYTFLFPESSLDILRLLSQVGVILFMFSVGLDVDAAHLIQRAPTAIAVSHFSIVVPFLLGVGTSLALFPQHAPPGVPFHSFALFMGIALSITAFPVLARVLEERGLTPNAARDDCPRLRGRRRCDGVGAAGDGRHAGDGGRDWRDAGVHGQRARDLRGPRWSGWCGRGSNARSNTRAAPLNRPQTGQVLVVLLASALLTEIIGIHALFGAFLAGVIMPPNHELRQQLRERLESFSSVFLLPIFFAYTGLRTEVGLLNDAAGWAVCGGIILTAVAGKLLGSMLAARWSGSSWHDAFVLGALMNTRGLMELVALNVGYDLGILSPQMFTMLVLMALVTTAMTGPLIDLASRRDARRGGQNREAVEAMLNAEC